MNCKKYQWQLRGGFMFAAIFLGLWQGYVKICCYYVKETVEQRLPSARRGTGHPNSLWS